MKECQLIHMPPDGTPETVALTLMQLIVVAEGKKFDAHFGAGDVVTRKWLLDTYAECLATVKNPGERRAAPERALTGVAA